jgi:effector-binding domain-containing protein
MIDPPVVVQTTARPTAVIRFTIPRAEIQSVMGPGIGELMSVLQAQGLAPSGPVYSRHWRMDPATFDFDLGIPVAAPVAPAGRVKPGELPAATVARTTYHGPYEGLGAAWGEFGAWIEARGHQAAEGLWECYVAGPESGPDASRWRTELNRPLLSQGAA